MTGPSNSATAYRGPLRMPTRTGDEDTIVARLVTGGNLTSGVTGLIAYNASNDPSSSTEWSSYFALYEEYRCIGMTLRFVPFRTAYINAASTTPLAFGVMVSAINRNSGVLSTGNPTAAWQHSTAVVKSIQQSRMISVRADGPAEMSYANCSAPSPTWNIELTAAGLDVSTVYGGIFIEWYVQFRNRF